MTDSVVVANSVVEESVMELALSTVADCVEEVSILENVAVTLATV